MLFASLRAAQRSQQRQRQERQRSQNFNMRHAGSVFGHQRARPIRFRTIDNGMPQERAIRVAIGRTDLNSN